MTFLRRLKAFFRPRTPNHFMRPATTTVHLTLKDGVERSFRLPGIQKGMALDIKIDALIDEMDDGNIASPISIIRQHPNGDVTREEMKIYSTVEED